MKNKYKTINFFDNSDLVKTAFEQANFPIECSIKKFGNKFIQRDMESNSNIISNFDEIPAAFIIVGCISDKKNNELMILSDYIIRRYPHYFLIEIECDELKTFPAFQKYRIFFQQIRRNDSKNVFYCEGVRSDFPEDFSLLKNCQIPEKFQLPGKTIWQMIAEQFKEFFPADNIKEKNSFSHTLEDNMERRFDVFVSSTYEDLIEERKEVTQAILESDCVPVGMEMFPASNLEQWKFIKRVIEQSDFYLVIIAGKYGSMGIDENGKKISYTEMEFDYAVKLNKPILVFMLKDPNELKRAKTEISEEKTELLNRFREKAGINRLFKYYTNKDELKAGVLSSLNSLKKQVNYGGWIRAAEAEQIMFPVNAETQKQLELKASLLEKQVQELKEKLSNTHEEKLRLNQKYQATQQRLTAHKKSQDSIKQAIAILKTGLDESQ